MTQNHANKKSDIRLGTRGSQLALWQSNWVKCELEKLGVSVELITIKTEGDIQTGSLAQIGGQGLFTKRLQVALLNEEIDLAVHSLKDLPTEDHPQLTIAAVPPRETVADALVSNRFTSLQDLPPQAVIGTGSVRRAAQLLHLRPDLEIRDIRGNVDTRLKKLDAGEFDAIILASAGLLRLGFEKRISYKFPPNELVPAVGQGALGLETRRTDEATISRIASLNDPVSFHRAMAERAMLRTLYAGCLSPVGALTHVHNGLLQLKGAVLSHDGEHKIECEETSDLEQSNSLGQRVAEKLIEAGAAKYLQDRD
ncbi:hydroxymethylbilane synthase [Mariniblastus sp.]|nr:hydroxymethylbilane synthase [Mariniblastus sp.]